MPPEPVSEMEELRESKYVTSSEFMADGGWHLGQAS
jgi:hypothetical protein